jgi:hypothetical protein|tara:strand:+ start:997 stop:1665 length:669 start_codon:yes stop_codon:yes gene_type:complete
MKLSKSTLDILKNFSNINQSICFKEGTELSTLSIQKNILSRANVEEKFPKSFAIYDLSEFLSGLTLFEDPEFSFDNDNFVIIKDRKNSSRYFFADPSTIVTPPENKVELPSKDVCFTVAWSDISNVIKAAAIYQIEDLAVVGDGSKIKLVVRDKKNDTSNSYAVDVGTTDKNFSFNFKVENLKLLPGDYQVVISKQNASLFRDANRDLEYLIALEPDSKYEG